MKQFDENKFCRETETGYLLAMALLNLLVLCAAAGFFWLLYLLMASTNSLAIFVREFSTR